MKTISSIVQELTNNELKQAFDEITEWRKTGVLPQGIVRAVHEDYEVYNDIDSPLRVTEDHILYEMSKRAYNLL